MENGEWIHYPAKPGHYGCWEYVIGDKHHLCIVNYDESYPGEEYEANAGRYLGWVGVAPCGVYNIIHKNGNLAEVFPLRYQDTWPEVSDVEQAKAWLLHLWLTGAWKDYVKEKT